MEWKNSEEILEIPSLRGLNLRCLQMISLFQHGPFFHNSAPMWLVPRRERRSLLLGSSSHPPTGRPWPVHLPPSSHPILSQLMKQIIAETEKKGGSGDAQLGGRGDIMSPGSRHISPGVNIMRNEKWPLKTHCCRLSGDVFIEGATVRPGPAQPGKPSLHPTDPQNGNLQITPQPPPLPPPKNNNVKSSYKIWRGPLSLPVRKYRCTHG